MYRTHTCGELRKTHIGQTAKLAGRVNDIRKFGGLTFFTIRDRYGVTQITCPENLSSELQEIVSSLKYEYCIQVEGQVISRPDGQINTNMPTGEIELELENIYILTTSKELPFQIVDDPKTSEEIRYKHRYLDLRRRKVLDNIQFRAKMNHRTRNRFTDNGFTEIQTPIFTVSSPEGARDYLIPSRVNPGKFYALPQAPQQYKQLLMVGGLDKYFQIAPCFRDEDPRADRHSCEFYQIDCEMSFADQNDVHNVAEAYISQTIPSLSTKTIINPINRLPRLSQYILSESKSNFPKIPYAIAMELFGSDKPDLRFDCRIWDITDISGLMGIGFIDDAISQGNNLKAIILNKVISRKEIDSITDAAKQAGASGMPYIYIDNGEIKGSIAKFITPDIYEQLSNFTGLQDNQTMFIFLGKGLEANKIANKVRLDLRDRYQMIDKNELAFCWIVNFPFFEKNDEDKLDFAHNPFSMVSGGVAKLQAVIDEGANPIDIVSDQYDMVCNGYEILSGSIRNHYPEVLVKVFEFVGKTEQDVRNKFGAMYEAFQYGCPPHGGFAFGFDRLLMILLDEENIREVYAFPKSGRAEDTMMSAPSHIDPAQLDELHIKVIE